MSETALTSSPPLAPGWWGKLPALGDFASRRLPDTFVAGWDEWLRHGLSASREALGPRWLEGYLVAPIVRFWLAPGLLGATSWTGLAMPSLDRVGRHYPLTVARPGLALSQAQALPGWFDALDAAMRQVLDLRFTVDDLEQGLAAAAAGADWPAPAPEDDEVRGSVWWFSRAGGELRCRFDTLPPAAAFTALLGACA